MKVNSRILLLFIIIVQGIIPWLQMTSNKVYAQTGEEWSPVKKIPGYGSNTLTPYAVADNDGTIHAFVSDWVGLNQSKLAIFYSRWDLNQGWTIPTDIILSPHHQARVKGAFLDRSGNIHVVFYGGEDGNAEIYYSKAPADQAANAQSWSKPLVVGYKAITPDEAAITGDEFGNIHIVFATRKDGNSLYSVHSSDGGETWNEPRPIYISNSIELFPSHLNIYSDKDNNLHAVWSVADSTGNGLAVYYAQLRASTSRWTEPFVLDVSSGFEADTPSIIEYNDELIVIYHNDSPTTRHMRRSTDGGANWTQPMRLFQHVGSNGAASMVIDGNNSLHMFFGNRVGSPQINGMWHSTWLGRSWSLPTPIISGPKTDTFDPSFANAVVSKGNTIMVMWHEDPQAVNSSGAKYSYLQWGTAEVADTPIPATYQEQPNATVTEIISENTISVADTPISVPIDGTQVENDIFAESSTSTLIIIGILPAVFILFLYLLLRLFRKTN